MVLSPLPSASYIPLAGKFNDHRPRRYSICTGFCEYYEVYNYIHQYKAPRKRETLLRMKVEQLVLRRVSNATYCNARATNYLLRSAGL